MIKLFKIFLVSLLFFFSVSGTSQINTDRVLEAGRYALYQQEYVLAISFFNKAIESKPYLGLPYYFRARAKYNLDDLTGAEIDMVKAINIIPFYYEFYRFRGDIRGRLGKHKEALEDYSKGLEIEPNDMGIYFSRGLVHMDMKDWQKSIEDFTSVLKIEPAQYGAYINRAIAKLNSKDTLGAVTDMDEAIAVNPLVAEAYRFSAAIYYDINNFDKALERIDAGINIDAREPVYYMLRGAIRYQMDDLQGTMDDFNKVIQLQPKNIMAYANRGLLRAEVGDVNNAIDDFSRVLALNPGDLLTLFNRALLYNRVGQFNDAISDLNIIIKRYPNYSDAYLARSQAYGGLHKQDEQVKDLNMAMKLQQEERKRAEKNNQLAQSGTTAKNKPKETRSESDENISNHDKIVVLDDFSVEENDRDELTDLKGQIQFKNINIDLEKVYSLTFFSENNTVDNTKYFKPEVTRFNSRNVIEKTLVFSNKELEDEANETFQYYRTIEDATLKLNNNPGNIDLRFIRAILYGVVMNYSGALNDYNYLIENSPKNNPDLIFYYLNRAAIRYKMVEVMQSFEEDKLPEDLIKSKTSKDKDEDKVIKKMLDYDLIERDLKKVIDINPAYEFAYYNLGILYCVKKDYEGAVRQFSNAIMLNSQFAEAYFNRGLTKIFLKDESQGTLDLSKAGELGLYKAYNIIKRYGEKKVNGEEEESEE